MPLLVLLSIQGFSFQTQQQGPAALAKLAVHQAPHSSYLAQMRQVLQKIKAPA